MRFSGQGGEGRRHLREAGADVCCHGPPSRFVIFVAGVGLGDSDAEVVTQQLPAWRGVAAHLTVPEGAVPVLCTVTGP